MACRAVPKTALKAALATALAAALLTGCATRAPQPGTSVTETRFDQLVVPGRTTRAELLAAFGPTKTVVFDSGMETWLYTAPAPGGRSTELVLLVGRDGIVHKMRKRPPYPGDPQP
jgi:outer membrane protein assembly factor BamE (lipoprotein component of BamABCDE complex)